MSKLKLEKLYRNAEKIDFKFYVTYVMKLLDFKLNESRFKHHRKHYRVYSKSSFKKDSEYIIDNFMPPTEKQI
jgi:hypothetical protein